MPSVIDVAAAVLAAREQSAFFKKKFQVRRRFSQISAEI